jgi:murein DD-endopeptidase MepM/ murein hydrolase activator NlpD
MGRRTRRRRRAFAPLALVALGALAAWGACCGPRHPERYPPRATSPYRLPFAGRRLVCQGNNGAISHHGWEEFAYDFYMPEDTPVLAARGGRVIRAVNDHDSFGFDAPANLVAVDHGDGTVGWYLHLRKGGALVAPGALVRRGDEIARSGWTGRALIPHLHFHVTRGEHGETIPVTFADADGDGIPRAPWWTGRE